jgi:hypothetical protein
MIKLQLRVLNYTAYECTLIQLDALILVFGLFNIQFCLAFAQFQ